MEKYHVTITKVKDLLTLTNLRTNPPKESVEFLLNRSQRNLFLGGEIPDYVIVGDLSVVIEKLDTAKEQLEELVERMEKYLDHKEQEDL